MTLNKIRVFIAIDTPTELKIQAEEIQRELNKSNPPVKWENIYKLHITLKFLGEIERGKIPDIESSLRDLIKSHKRFRIRYDKLGYFPDTRNPRIIWIGCRPLSLGLFNLWQDIENSCNRIGFPKEKHSFHPHVTIGRVKKKHRGRRGDLTDLIYKIETITFDSIDSKADSVLLMESRLKPQESEYRAITQFPLKI